MIKPTLEDTRDQQQELFGAEKAKEICSKQNIDLIRRKDELKNINEEMRRQTEAKKIELASCSTRLQALSKSHLQIEAQKEILEAKLIKSRGDAETFKEKISSASENHDSFKAELARLFTERDEKQQQLEEKRADNSTLIDQFKQVVDLLEAS